MPIAVSTKEEFEYVLESERDEAGNPKEGATVFVCRPLTTVEYNQVFVASGNVIFGSGELAVRRGLLSWRNFKDAAGNDVRLARSGGRISDDSINRLSPDWLAELGAEILKRSRAGAEDLGK